MKPCRFALFAAASALAFTASAAEQVAHAPSSPLGIGKLSEVFGALALVVLMIFGLALAAQRLRLARGVSGKHLRIVDALALGTRERLLLVDVAGERVLLGVAGGRIERLHVLATPATGDFSTVLDAAHAARPEAA
jgi:flagellar protein FliO/FliZ